MRKLLFYAVMMFCLIIFLLLVGMLASMDVTLDMLPISEAFGFLMFLIGMIAVAVVLRKLIDHIKLRKSIK